MSQDTTPTLLATYSSDVEANIARGVLQTHGIPAFIDNEIMSGVYPCTLSPLGELRLMVRACDVDRARTVLASDAHNFA